MTRLVAEEEKATKLPLLLVEGVSLVPNPATGVTLLSLETKLVVPFAPAKRSRL